LRRPVAPSSYALPNRAFTPCFVITAAMRALADDPRGPNDLRRHAVGEKMLTMITVQGALWEIRLGTFPSKELLPPGHGGVADHEDVGPLLLRRSDYGHGRVVVHEHLGPGPLPGQLERELLELVGRGSGPGRLGGPVLG